MCGRYSFAKKKEELEEELRILIEQDIPPRYNIAPTQSVAIVTNAGNIARKLTVKTVSEMWDAGKGIIVGAAAKILAEIAMGRHPQ